MAALEALVVAVAAASAAGCAGADGWPADDEGAVAPAVGDVSPCSAGLLAGVEACAAAAGEFDVLAEARR